MRTTRYDSGITAPVVRHTDPLPDVEEQIAHQHALVRSVGGEVHKMVAHQAPVSSLAIDPSGVYLASTDHGLSIRFWEISSKNCVQEITVRVPFPRDPRSPRRAL